MSVPGSRCFSPVLGYPRLAQRHPMPIKVGSISEYAQWLPTGRNHRNNLKTHTAACKKNLKNKKTPHNKKPPIIALFILENTRGPSPPHPALQAEQTTVKPRRLSVGQTTAQPPGECEPAGTVGKPDLITNLSSFFNFLSLWSSVSRPQPLLCRGGMWWCPPPWPRT